MTDIDCEDVTPLSIADAAYVVRDGLDLLEIVDHVDDSRAEHGLLSVATEGGPIHIQVRLHEAPAVTHISEPFGGIWGEHPDHDPSDWRQEVENHDTRLGYWDWVAAKIDEAEVEAGTEVENSDTGSAEQVDGSVDYSRDYSLDRPTY
jgi:hypothetical protein